MHDCALIKKAFDSYKEEIGSSLEPMKKQVTTIEKALAQLDACCGEISGQRAVTEDRIHITFRRLREVLNVSSQGILLKSGNKFPTKKFLHRYVCYGAYKHVSKDLIPIPLGEPVRNIYILKLMYFQW